MRVRQREVRYRHTAPRDLGGKASGEEGRGREEFPGHWHQEGVAVRPAP